MSKQDIPYCCPMVSNVYLDAGAEEGLSEELCSSLPVSSCAEL